MLARLNLHSSRTRLAATHAVFAPSRAAAASETPVWRWARRVALAAVVVAVAFIGLGNAQGATLSGSIGGPATYTAGNPISNNLTVTFDGSTYTFVDPGDGITATGDCSGGGSQGTPATCPATITSVSIGLADNNDTITVLSTGDPTTIDAGTGTDTIVATSNADFTLGNASLTVGTSTFTLSGFEDATLTGGGAANTFDVTGWDAGSADLDGGGGTDTVNDDLSTGGSGFTLSDSSLTRSGGPTFSLDNFAGETANLTGGGGNDAFTVSNWSGGGSLSGGSGSDTVVSINNASLQTVTDALLTARRLDLRPQLDRRRFAIRRLERQHHRREYPNRLWRNAHWKQRQRHADGRPR